jgi:hypothetical protein
MQNQKNNLSKKGRENIITKTSYANLTIIVLTQKTSTVVLFTET